MCRLLCINILYQIYGSKFLLKYFDSLLNVYRLHYETKIRRVSIIIDITDLQKNLLNSPTLRISEKFCKTIKGLQKKKRYFLPLSSGLLFQERPNINCLYTVCMYHLLYLYFECIGLKIIPFFCINVNYY